MVFIRPFGIFNRHLFIWVICLYSVEWEWLIKVTKIIDLGNFCERIVSAKFFFFSLLTINGLLKRKTLLSFQTKKKQVK